jgi:hypothetical protein
VRIRGNQLLWIALAAAVAVWAVGRLGSGDARILRQKLARLEELIEKVSGENNLTGADKARRIGDLLTPQFEIDVVPYAEKISDRRELVRVAMAYRSRSRTVGLDFRDQELEIDPAGRSARLDAVAAVAGDDGRRESYRVAVDWEKSGRDWLIRRVTVLEVLEGAPLF